MGRRGKGPPCVCWRGRNGMRGRRICSARPAKRGADRGVGAISLCACAVQQGGSEQVAALCMLLARMGVGFNGRKAWVGWMTLRFGGGGWGERGEGARRHAQRKRRPKTTGSQGSKGGDETAAQRRRREQERVCMCAQLKGGACGAAVEGGVAAVARAGRGSTQFV